MKFVLEACVDSVESARAAQAGGATRFELCGNLIIGGTTPDSFLFSRVQECCTLPIHVLIRPRFGDFLYTDEEFMLMEQQVSWFAAHGARAVVIGMLTPDGALDRDGMARLIEAAQAQNPDCKITLHRAFDVCRDPFAALETAKELGVNTILTSGQAASCVQGAPLLTELVHRAGDDVEILIGAGVNAAVIGDLLPLTGAHAFHMSGKRTLDSQMTYRREGVPMGLPGISEFEIWRTDAQAIAQARQVLDTYFAG